MALIFTSLITLQVARIFLFVTLLIPACLWIIYSKHSNSKWIKRFSIATLTAMVLTVVFFSRTSINSYGFGNAGIVWSTGFVLSCYIFRKRGLIQAMFLSIFLILFANNLFGTEIVPIQLYNGFSIPDLINFIVFYLVYFANLPFFYKMLDTKRLLKYFLIFFAVFFPLNFFVLLPGPVYLISGFTDLGGILFNYVSLIQRALVLTAVILCTNVSGIMLPSDDLPMKVAIVDEPSFLNQNLTASLGVSYYMRKKKGFTDAWGPYTIRLWNTYIYPLQIVRRAIKDRLTIVHLQNDTYTYGTYLSTMMIFPLMLILRFIGKKIVVTIHVPITEVMPTINSTMVFFVRIYYRMVYKLANQILTSCEVFASRLASIGVMSKIIPWGAYKIPEYNFSAHNPIIILCHGHISARKDIGMLIEAVKLMSNKNIRVIVSGSASRTQKQYLQDLKDKAKGLPIEFTGGITTELMYKLMRMSDIWVLPYTISTTSDILCFAFGCNKPVVVTEIAYFIDTLKNEWDALFIRDEYEMAKALDRLVEDPKLRYQLGENIGQFATTRSWNAVAEMTRRVYNSI